jgi:hypothetical protein
MFVTCTWIGSFLVHQRLISVLDEILHVAHLVVGRKQVVHIGPRALFDPAQERVNTSDLTSSQHCGLLGYETV